jgi:hypothetical protein
MKRQGAVLIVFGAMLLTLYVAFLIMSRTIGSGDPGWLIILLLAVPPIAVGTLILGVLRWFDSTVQR